ncbi:predicted protein [Naegleria gruberi]|uniref:Predicted protein n=1 Tax=Naegleria gruberi TaxID=5762 RepID=D2V6I5_NAEGR|nr:uncharacterized protein NAEGRDRAFT_64450 [Naegleria gruberi]EFC47580.1 predicted protein [Naegleria gruberi]|eukprot:XP_002680324.1 predicted protein [Naegleria gruberi strain NEG-M]
MSITILNNMTKLLSSIIVSPPIPWNQDQTHDILDQCSYAYPLYISRINRIPPHQSWRVYVLGFIFGFGLLCYVVAFSLTIWRRNKQPLKDRSVFLLLISGVTGSIALAYM